MSDLIRFAKAHIYLISAIGIVLFVSFLVNKYIFEVDLNLSEANIACDVVVVGGGAGGFAAGLQSARLGIKTCIIEETPWLGGMFTSAGISVFDGLSNSGIFAEVKQRLRNFYGKAIDSCMISDSCFEPKVGAQILAQMANEAPNLKLFLNSKILSVSRENRGGLIHINSVRFKNQSGATNILSGKIFIDASEYGDLIKMSGVGYDSGLDFGTGEPALDRVNAGLPANSVNPATFAMVLKNYNRDVTIPRPQGYTEWRFRCSLADQKIDDNGNPIDCSKLSFINPNWTWDKGLRQYMNLTTKDGSEKIVINWPLMGNDYPGVNLSEMSPEKRQETYKQMKLHSLQYLYYLQTVMGKNTWGLADDEYDTPDKFPYIPYVREGRRVKGLTRIIQKDIDPAPEFAVNQGKSVGQEVRGRFIPDSIAIGDYTLDIHPVIAEKCKPENGCNKPELMKFGLDGRDNPYEEQLGFNTGEIPNEFIFHNRFQIPFGAIVAADADNLLAVEKNISVSHIANGATRLQPVSMRVGQAAGVAAALSVQKGSLPRNLDVKEIQKTLIKNKAQIFWYKDIPLDHIFFEIVQKAAAYSIYPKDGSFELEKPITRKESAELLDKAFNYANSRVRNLSRFNDISPDDPYFESVKKLYEAGVTAGCSANPPLFCSNRNLTRGEASVFIIKSLGLTPLKKDTPTFSDVPVSHPFFGFVERLAERGITVGCGGGRFCIDDPITRPQLMVFIVRALGL